MYVSWLRVMLLMVLAATTAAAQGGFDRSVRDTRLGQPSGIFSILRVMPEDGSVGVALDRTAALFLSRPITANRIGSGAILAVGSSGSIATELRTGIGGRTIVISFPDFLPPNDTVEIRVDGDRIRSRNSIPLDADGDGVPGGQAVFTFSTGDAVPPPIQSGTATILGYVFDEDGTPLADALVESYFFPRQSDDTPPLTQVTSDANGYYEFPTIEFAESETFLVRVTKEIDEQTRYSEILREVSVMPGRCWRMADARLMLLNPPKFVAKGQADTIEDKDAGVQLIIPKDALREDSNISVTVLPAADMIRDELPRFVAPQGVFVDIAGVFGDSTDEPVMLRVPNTFGLPERTLVPFGKVDHNTLEWVDLRDVGTAGEVGIVTDDGKFIEVKFDNFCTVCTGYCLPFPEDPEAETDGQEPCPPQGDCDCPGAVAGDSSVGLRDGSLTEFVRLPGMRELGRSVGLSLAYRSTTARPSAVLSTTVDYGSPRPIEATIFDYEIEGTQIRAVFDRSENGVVPHANFAWDGRDAFGVLLRTGSYDYVTRATSLNADTEVSLPDVFGEQAVVTFNDILYAGLVPQRTERLERRTILVNLRESPYGAGWSLMNERRLYFDPDGCIVLLRGNSLASLFVPDPDSPNRWISPSGDFSALVRNPQDGYYIRSFDDGAREVYTPAGRIERLEDRYGYTTIFEYTGDLLTQITTATGYLFTLGYDGNGKLSEISDSAGRTTQFMIDAAGDLVRVVDAEGGERDFAYDADHVLISQTGSRGDRSEYDHEGGRVFATRSYDVQSGPLLRARSFEPSVLRNEIGAALAAGMGTFGNPIPIVTDRLDRYIDGRGYLTVHETDRRGNTVREVDPLGRETRYVYDGNDLLIRVIRPSAVATELDYSASGEPVVVRQLDDGGNSYSTTTFEYEERFGLPVRLVDAEQKETRFNYDDLGNLRSVTDHVGSQTRYFHLDSRFPSLPTQIVTAAGESVMIAYDQHGRTRSVTDYPGEGEFPGGRTLSLTYNDAGNVIRRTDGSGAATRYDYDNLNRMIAFTDALDNPPTEFAYGDDGCGCPTANLTQVTFSNGSQIDYVYDGLDRLVQEVDQLGEVSLVQYDGEGNIVAVTNREGETLEFIYDAAGQVIGEILPGGSSTRFDYDANGNLVLAEDDFCSIESEFDFVDRPVGARLLVADTSGNLQLLHDIAYAYDRIGNRRTLEDRAGRVDYVYDDLHRLATLTNARGASWFFTHDAVGRRLSVFNDLGSYEAAYSYDSAGQLRRIEYGTTPPSFVEYGPYNARGQVLAERQVTGGAEIAKAFEYDMAGQLVGAEFSTVLGDSRQRFDSAHDLANRLQSDGEYTYSYDREGRVVSREDAAQGIVRSYGYDAKSQLVSVREEYDNEGVLETILDVRYGYDPLGRRVHKSVNGVESYFVYDGSRLLHELDDSQGVVRSYTHGEALDDLLAFGDVEEPSEKTYLIDRLGSVSGWANGQAVESRVAYDEYGGTLAGQAGRARQLFGFAGRERDLETGLYYHRSRYRDPLVGSFLTEDRASLAGGRNFYTYAENDPTNLVDPSGEIPVLIVVAIPFIIYDAYQEAQEAPPGQRGSAYFGSIVQSVADIAGFGLGNLVEQLRDDGCIDFEEFGRELAEDLTAKGLGKRIDALADRIIPKRLKEYVNDEALDGLLDPVKDKLGGYVPDLVDASYIPDLFKQLNPSGRCKGGER